MSLERALVLRSPLFRATCIVLALAGCNSILDNQPGTPKPSTAPSSKAASDETDAGPATAASTSGDVPARPSKTPIPSPSSSAECAEGSTLCSGQCAAANDPAYGCGAPSCTPCAIAHGTAACTTNGCAVKTCDKGHADCNGAPDDGCEVDLSKAATCGSCSTACPAASPVCAPSGDAFRCESGCTPTAPLLCGTECVNPLASVNHCGSCGLPCPAVADAETTCTLGHCGFTCRAGLHTCAGRCVPESDPAACGPTCAACPTPPNAKPSCVVGTCSFTCTMGFLDCNQNPADGCEVAIGTDPLNCGGCGKSCAGGTCAAGTCSGPPADAGPPPPPAAPPPPGP